MPPISSAWLTVVAILAVFMFLSSFLNWELVKKARSIRAIAESRADWQQHRLQEATDKLDALTTQVKVLTDINEGMALHMQNMGIADPVWVYHPDGSRYSQDFVITEEP